MSKKIYIGPTIDGIAIRNTVYEELPEPLREIKQKYPTVKIYKTSPVSHGLKGNLHYMEVGAAMMFELGKVLWAGERK